MHPNDAAKAAEAIPGWMTNEELRWLAKTATTHQRILEIGTYAGRSTKAMALTTPGKILTIDTWRGEMGTPELHAENLMQVAHKNLRPHIESGVVTVQGISSAGLYMEWRYKQHEGFDFIFIDGNHDQSEVMFDLWACRQMLAPGGILAGHDHGVGGVREALLLELPDYKVQVHSIWAWEKPK